MAKKSVKKSRSHKALKRARQEKRKKQAVSIVLAVLMFGSLFAIVVSSWGSSSNSVDYGDYTFKPSYHEDGDYYTFQAKINKEKYDFYTVPQDVLSQINSNQTIDLFTQAQGVVLASDYSSEFASLYDLIRFEIDQEHLITIAGVQLTMDDFTNNSSQDGNITTVSCVDASATYPVIELREADDAQGFSVIESDYCAQIYFNQQTAVYARDYILYSLLGVI